ncbi:MAG: DNA polymerase III subunit delta [Bacteroidota bacterium]|nr:DNA polymerase III subunit delta [Bacteroidota bacterium]MDP4206126.1 DNA polymerase III subunit delta [Bacteroidota bacterium]
MMTFEQIIDNLKKKTYQPVYFLMGEESYYIDQITDYILDNVLTEAEKGFNLTILYGKETDVNSIIMASRRFPMMSEWQVVLVREAQNIKNIEDLVSYCEKPLKSTILVVNYKYSTLDKRKKLAKVVDKNGVLFESKKIYDNQLPAWINQYLKRHNFTITPQASQMLADFLGTDLNKVANELDKLVIVLPAGTQITPDHVEKNIGISKEYNIFELQNALGDKDVLKANRIINYFGANLNNNPLVKTISSLFFYFHKLLTLHYTADKSNASLAAALQVNIHFVEAYKRAAKNYSIRKVVEVIGILREYDMKSKGLGSTASPEDLQREMIYKILH